MPLLPADPKANFLAHADEIRAAIERVLASGHYILGPEVEAFEREFAGFQGGGEVITVANGTEALEIALRALGVGAGDLVATVGNTVTATVSAIQQVGAKPVFVEINPTTLVMDVDALDAELARRQGAIKAVVPVHLYGQMTDMPRLVEAAHRWSAKVLEDCAQAHGAAWAGALAGTYGDAAAFSFYPTKNLGALGDGGAVYSRDPALSARMRLLRQYGWKTRYVSEMPGRNSRLDEIQAAVLRVKLRYLCAENNRRRALAERYRAGLASTELILPVEAPDARHVYHQYTVRTPRRDALKDYLQMRDILCGILYPVPVYRQPAYSDPAHTLPITERACAEVLCLPCHPGLAEGDVDTVIRAILGWSAQA